MKRLFACVVVTALVTSVFTGSKSTSAQAPLTLIAVPSEGHPGDTIYLSGAGFEPSSTLYITLGCPDWYHSYLGNVESIRGARTDKYGHFVAFKRLRAMMLTGVSSSTCQVYASNGTSPFAVSAPYAIKAPGESLDKCAVQICVTATAHLAGSHLNLVLHGWPGAQVQVSVTYADGKTQYARTHLDWLGNQLLRVPLAEQVKRRAPPRFSVKAFMDHTQGTIRGHFPPALQP